MKTIISLSAKKSYPACVLAIKKAIKSKYPKFYVSPGEDEGDEYFCIVGKPKEQRTRAAMPIKAVAKIVVGVAKNNGFDIAYSDDDSDQTYQLAFVLNSSDESVKADEVPLPKGVVGVSYWQSSSSGLDYGLVELCKKAGVFVTFIDVDKYGYSGVVVSRQALDKKTLAFIEKNWARLPKQEDR